MTNRMRDVVTVPITAAQSARLQRLMAAAAAASTQRDEVLSALVESVTDQSMQGWNIQIKEREIVLTAPAPQWNDIDVGGLSPKENGQQDASQADAMSP